MIYRTILLIMIWRRHKHYHECKLDHARGNVYAFFINDRLREVFEVEYQSKLDESIAYQYILGYMDGYTTAIGAVNNSAQSRR